MIEKSNRSHVKEPLFQYVRDCYWSIFRGNTAILSSSCRQLALGIGGVLLIDHLSIPVLWSRVIFTLLVLFFIADAGQYLYQSISFRKLASKYDKEIECGEILEVSKLIEPPEISKWTNFLFYAKLGVLILAAIVFVILIWVR